MHISQTHMQIVLSAGPSQLGEQLFAPFQLKVIQHSPRPPSHPVLDFRIWVAYVEGVGR